MLFRSLLTSSKRFIAAIFEAKGEWKNAYDTFKEIYNLTQTTTDKCILDELERRMLAGDPKEEQDRSICVVPTDFHFFVRCDYCYVTIIGIRYKCTICVDFDLCATCMKEKAAEHDKNHIFRAMNAEDTAKLRVVTN